METSRNIFIACAIGGGVGAFLAHQFWYPSLWSTLLGFIAGGLVSYLDYEFKTVLRAIPVAWNRTTGWRPDKEWWRLYFTALPASISMTANLCIIMMLLFFVVSNGDRDAFFEFTCIIWAIGIAYFAGINCLFILPHGEGKRPTPAKVRSDLAIFYKFNPFYLYLWFIPKHALKGAWWVIKRIPKAVAVTLTFVVKFTKNFLRIIHSELRLLCLIYGGIGAIAGTLIADTLTGTFVGALAGGVLGVISFEAIFKRILHLVPSAR